MTLPITQRQRRWLDALLVLSTIAVGFVVVRFLADVFFWFGDIILIFFLAWLLAFILSPIVARLTKAIENLARAIQFRDDEFTVSNCLNEVRTYLAGMSS